MRLMLKWWLYPWLRVHRLWYFLNLTFRQLYEKFLVWVVFWIEVGDWFIIGNNCIIMNEIKFLYFCSIFLNELHALILALENKWRFLKLWNFISVRSQKSHLYIRNQFNLKISSVIKLLNLIRDLINKFFSFEFSSFFISS